ncbi:MAG: hypothetical protein NTX54_10650 [Chloroflexi bacterium]|nr:hypothetical protein [Chloroflexota bacterium]
MSGFWRGIGLFTLAIACFLGSPIAHADSPGVSPGTVVVLRGTAHIWVADDDGVLHWVGDTRAFSGKRVDWDAKLEVTRDEIAQYRRGGPWLSSGLLKLGDPIYLVKWETSETSPKLLHIQSLADVELFGISGDNWGTLVYDQALWERRFGIGASTLAKGVLAPVTSPPVTPNTVVATPVIVANSVVGAGTTTALVTTTPTIDARSEAYRLNRTPRLAADGDITLGSGASWTEGTGINAKDHRFDTIYSSHVLHEWTVVSGGDPIFARVVATNLDYNKDVATPSDLARKVLSFYCIGSTTCTGTNTPSGTTIVGGFPALRYDTRTRIEYWDGCSGCTQTQVQHEWVAIHLFVIRGNWGYEIRVFGEYPATFLTKVQDFLTAVAKTELRTNP